MESMEIVIPEATKEESKSIKAINKDTVHKICSGQVSYSIEKSIQMYKNQHGCVFIRWC